MAVLQWQHHPPLRPLQVPKILSGIHRNWQRVHLVPTLHSTNSLLLVLTNQRPREVVMSLLQFSPRRDRYQCQRP